MGTVCVREGRKEGMSDDMVALCVSHLPSSCCLVLHPRSSSPPPPSPVLLLCRPFLLSIMISLRVTVNLISHLSFALSSRNLGFM